MKKYIILSLFISFLSSFADAQLVLSADGPGDTYSLIISKLAPDYNPIEVPDCGHETFGDHIDEIYDEELNSNVFRFHVHKNHDDDRCINFDRQRCEIKSYDKSPDSLLGVQGEHVEYKWKFKLDANFQSSPKFTHIHQLKAVGGSESSMPLLTLTTRSGSPDNLELRYAEALSQVSLKKTDLTPFKGIWCEVSENVTYGENGYYSLNIRRVSDSSLLFSFESDNIRMWKTDADFIRPKWGIYRSLLHVDDLRDEMVLFADFEIEEIELTSASAKINSDNIKVFPNPSNGYIKIKGLENGDEIIVFDLNGHAIFESIKTPAFRGEIDLSPFGKGIYIVKISTGSNYILKKIMR